MGKALICGHNVKVSEKRQESRRPHSRSCRNSLGQGLRQTARTQNEQVKQELASEGLSTAPGMQHVRSRTIAPLAAKLCPNT